MQNVLAHQPETLAPCGLYCGVCKIYQATQAGDHRYLERLVRVYARRFPEIRSACADDLLCDGCLSARRSLTCRDCQIRRCTQSKGLQGCHQCQDFPCTYIAEFPMPVGKKVILRAVPYWRRHGTQAWVEAEEQRYHCPTCSGALFRGARQCPTCNSQVDVD
jgi:hypothetical protein